MFFSLHNHNSELTSKKNLDGSSSSKGRGHFLDLKKSCFKLGTSTLICSRPPVLQSHEEIHACLWSECKAESWASSLPQRQEAHSFHIVYICSRKSSFSMSDTQWAAQLTKLYPLLGTALLPSLLSSYTGQHQSQQGSHFDTVEKTTVLGNSAKSRWMAGIKRLAGQHSSRQPDSGLEDHRVQFTVQHSVKYVLRVQQCNQVKITRVYKYKFSWP